MISLATNYRTNYRHRADGLSRAICVGSRARKRTTRLGDGRAKGSPERFGYSWQRFSELTRAQERQFQLWTAPIDPATGWNGVRFLDGGCGIGRNSYWPMTYGAASAVAVDIDDASLAAARANLARFPAVEEVKRASIYGLPFENEFDIAFSIGVIHHLDDPDAAVGRMVRATRPGGRVLIWVYGYENLEFYVNVLNPLRKALFARLPLSFVRFLALFPTAMLWLMLRLGITPMAYLKMLRSFPFAHLRHIVFDQMLPQTAANHWREQEARGLLERAGLLRNVVIRHVNDCSWSVMGFKPA